MSRLPLQLKEKAFTMRKKGYPVREIAEILKIARSTSSLWVRNIKLNKQAQKRLYKNRKLGYYKASLTWQKKQEKELKRYDRQSKALISKLKINQDYAKLLCSIFYWCEGGSNKNFKEGVRFVNSDPALIKTFLSLFRKAYSLDEKSLEF